jgi:hypothetical protein
MDNLKVFDPDDIDETLSRVVSHGGRAYLMFPYVDAVGTAPKFNSVSLVIDGPAATIKDFAALSASVRQAAGSARWYISFNTPWLLLPTEAESKAQRAPHGRVRRR